MQAMPSAPLAAFNQAQKENDNCYRSYARSVGLSDTAFWILYSVAEREMPYTQKELCSGWFFPMQTINSALKELCKRGILQLEPLPTNRKAKLIRLTAEGEQLVLHAIAPLFDAEDRALTRMGKAEYERYLEMTRRHVALFHEEIDTLLQTKD